MIRSPALNWRSVHSAPPSKGALPSHSVSSSESFPLNKSIDRSTLRISGVTSFSFIGLLYTSRCTALLNSMVQKGIGIVSRRLPDDGHQLVRPSTRGLPDRSVHP